MVTWVPFVVVAYLVAFVLITAWTLRRSTKSGRSCCCIPLRVASTNRLHRTIDEPAPRTFMAWEWHDAADFYTSSIVRGRVGIALLLAFRVLMFLFFVFGLLFQFLAPESLASGARDDYLKYFTNWTYVGYGVHSFLGVLVSARGLRRSSSTKSVLGQAAREPFDALAKAFAITSAAIPASSFFLTVAYWSVLYDNTLKLQFETVQKHGLTAIVLVVEYAISRNPLTSTWLIAPILYSSGYMLFFWIFWRTDDEWVYPVLDWRERKTLVYYGILPILVLVAFWILFGFVRLREAIIGGPRTSDTAVAGGGKRTYDSQLATRSSSSSASQV